MQCHQNPDSKMEIPIWVNRCHIEANIVHMRWRWACLVIKEHQTGRRVPNQANPILKHWTAVLFCSVQPHTRIDTHIHFILISEDWEQTSSRANDMFLFYVQTKIFKYILIIQKTHDCIYWENLWAFLINKISSLFNLWISCLGVCILKHKTPVSWWCRTSCCVQESSLCCNLLFSEGWKVVYNTSSMCATDKGRELHLLP